MKKYFLLASLLLTSISTWAQAAGGSSSNSIILVIIVAVVIFIACRELICWYYKINKMVSNQEEIIRLLKTIADNSNKNKE